MHDTEEDSCSTVPQTRGSCYALASSPEAYADLVTVAGFKPVVAAEKSPGGFDSLPLPWVDCLSTLQLTRNRANLLQLTHFLAIGGRVHSDTVSGHFRPVLVIRA